MNGGRFLNGLFVGIVMSFVFVSQGFAQFDSMPITPFSLGGAAIAASLGPESAIHNPAGVFGIKDMHLELGHTSGFADTQTSWVSIGKRMLNNTVINFALPMRIINHDRTVADGLGQGLATGTFGDTHAAALLSVATEIRPGITVGISGKYEIQTLDTEKMSAVGVDAGIQYHNSIGRLGVVLRNIGGKSAQWSTGRTEHTATTVGIGLQLALPFHTTVVGDVSVTQDTSEVDLGISSAVGDYLTVMGGVSDVTTTPSLRLGTALDLSGFTVRYAASLHEQLGVSHRVGLCFTKF